MVLYRLHMELEPYVAGLSTQVNSMDIVETIPSDNGDRSLRERAWIRFTLTGTVC